MRANIVSIPFFFGLVPKTTPVILPLVLSLPTLFGHSHDKN